MLGNLFLRTTSVAMQGRILGGPPRTFEEILRDEAERSPNRLLFHAVLDLPDKFQAYMDKLEISDALAAIVDILRLVCCIFSSPSFARLFYLRRFNLNRPIRL